MTPSRVGTSRATQPTKASAAKEVSRGSFEVGRGSVDRFSSDRHSSSTGWASPRRAGPPAVAVGRSSATNSFGVSGQSAASIAPSADSRSNDVPEMWDVPFDSERLAQLASASPVSRRRLTLLLQEVQSEIGRIFGNDRSNLAPTPEGAAVSSSTDFKLVGSGAAYERGLPSAGPGTAASGSTGVPSTASMSAAGTASSLMAESSPAVALSPAASSAEAQAPGEAIVRRLCDRVCHLQSSLDAVWEAGLEASSDNPHGGRDVVSPNRRYEGPPETVAGLARLEDVLERLENQVSVSFPILKNAMSEAGRPDGRRQELSTTVGELEQQKMALEAEVRSLMQQKQEIKAGANASGPPIGITPRRSTPGTDRNSVISPEHLRKVSSPDPVSLSRDHGTMSTGDFDAESEVTCDLASGIAPSPPTASPGQVISGTVARPQRVGWMEEEGATGNRSTYVLAGPGAAVAGASGVAANAAATMAAAPGGLPMPVGSVQPNRGGSVAMPPVPPVMGLSALRGVPANGAQARIHPGGVPAGSHNVRVAQGTPVQACVLAATQNTPPSSPRPYTSSMQPMMSSYATLARSPQRPRQATPGHRPSA